MNIFYLDRSIDDCVKMHLDKHVVKMCIEYAQLLSTAIQVSDPSSVNEFTYKSTHKNHPDSIWTRESLDNWLYLRDLAIALGDEYHFRYGQINNKRHKSIELVVKNLKVPSLPRRGFTDPPQCMPDACKKEDAVEAYREYYRTSKADIAFWTKREIPSWWST